MYIRSEEHYLQLLTNALTHSNKRPTATTALDTKNTRPLTTNCNDPLSGIWRETALKKRQLSTMFPKDVVRVDYVISYVSVYSVGL
jgi:hypothetical protein